MPRVPTILLLLAVLGPMGASAQDSLANGDIREVRIEMAPGTRVEYFRLDLPSESNEGELPARRPPPVGLVRWLSGPDATSTDGRGAWYVECDVILFEADTRIVHTERIGAALRELVFRELRSRAGRTLRFRWTPDGKGASLETIGGELLRREFDLSGGAALPLSLIEVVRRGDEWPGDVSVFRPLAGDLETLRPVVARDGGSRVLELFSLRSGGASDLCAGSYRFEGDSLVSFRWQDGGPVASAVGADEYTRWKSAGPAAARDG